MATHLFEDRIHAAFYQKYRFTPQENLQRAIFSYLEKKVNSFRLAVDVGCGSGQSTLFLAKHFEKVVGMDISAAQIEEAKRAPHPPNVSYAVSPAEDLPFEAGSVDLITAFASVHWFDTPRFLSEVDRVLKPSGCVVFSSYNQDMRVCYRDLTEKLTQIFTENRDQLFNYADEKVKGVLNDYQEVFDALPYADKERLTDIVDKVPMSIADLMGYIQSLSMYQAFQKAQPEAAKALLQNTERRFLETMSVSSRKTQVELEMRHVCILGCKMS
ncbi:putative methyltransferase DDB_G0268948 [Sceloporus undulatus]|uniref:putative methyltransferase DDB_G0268948 n=1 Tax=Sceloporus undulatus TaxID=8520 RepID=UPI001C4C8F02|nr:putative methyltransferase DDB_G0268948 [Sceloporus undulatus]